MNIKMIEEVVLDQKESFAKKRGFIQREIRLEQYKKHDQIVVISGIRRCGKSTLLRQFSELYEEYNFINFDDERLINFTVDDFAELMVLFKKQSDAKVIFMDEVQNIDKWERFARRLHDEGYKLYITGSNSKLLSSELGTHLTGRYAKIELFPFSFREYLDFYNIQKSPFSSQVKAGLLKHFDSYLENGGFPEYLKYDDREFLSRTYEDIIYRDIISRHGIKDAKSYMQLSHYIFSNFTGDMNYTAVKNALNIKSLASVKNYISYLEESYLAFELYKYDYSLKKQHINHKKIYVIDNGMRNEVSFRFSADMGKLLENMVFVELLRSQKSVYMHKEKGECDFILKSRNVIIEAMQVCYDVNGRNRKRELNGLVEAAKRYNLNSGKILTYNQTEELHIDGINIKLIPVWQWLLAKNDCRAGSA
jgi:predicted AAA+ superfamily ATPase